MFESDSEDLVVEQIEGVAKLTLNRPEARNALSSGMTRNLIEAVRWATVDDAVRACLLYTSPSPRDKRQSRMPSSA